MHLKLPVSRSILLPHYCLTFILLLSSNTSIAEEAKEALFTSHMKTLNLSPFIEILVDPEQALTFEDISSSSMSGTFIPAPGTENSFGFTKAAYWVRLSLRMEQSLSQSILLQLDSPLMDNVQFYIPDENGNYSKVESGESFFFKQRELEHRTYVFNLPRHIGQSRTYYMRLQTEGSMQIPLYLWTQQAFIVQTDKSSLFLGGYFGLMMLLVLVALAAYQKIRDRLFLAYAAYLSSYLLLQLSLLGFGFQYLWPELPEWSNRVNSASVGLAVIFGLLFSGMFLQVFGQKHPRIKYSFLIMIVCSTVCVGVSFLGDFSIAAKASTILGITLPPVVLIGAISSLVTGYRPARYFLVAWCIFLCGVFIAGLLFLGFLPHTFFTFYAMQIGSSFEVLLLGYALMDRIELMRTEKESAQQQASQCLLKLNGELESLVAERTKSLQKMNEELREQAIHDSMTGLLNHSASLDFLKLMQTSALRYGGGLAVIMIDIDHFKAINDKYGHPAGDQVIKAIANTIKACLRQSDACGRYGGEEFIFVTSQSDAGSAKQLAERIKESIKQLSIPEIDNEKLTVSIGIALLDPLHPKNNLVARADQALYEAKSTGRNKVVLAEDLGTNVILE